MVTPASTAAPPNQLVNACVFLVLRLLVHTPIGAGADWIDVGSSDCWGPTTGQSPALSGQKTIEPSTKRCAASDEEINPLYVDVVQYGPVLKTIKVR